METTHITSFMEASQEWADEQTYASAIWVLETNGWVKISEHDDPYSAVVPMLLTGRPSILEMFGWMKRIDETTHEPVEDEAKVRVRIMLSYDDDNISVGVQRSGEMDFFHDDGVEGTFLDFLNNARKFVGTV